MALTYFVAALTCPECGGVTPEDSSTGMRNHLGSGHGVQVLRVGDGGITLPNIASEYIQVRDPGDGREVRLLETWTCAACSSENWAVVTIRDGMIESIEARPVSRASCSTTSTSSRRTSLTSSRRSRRVPRTSTACGPSSRSSYDACFPRRPCWTFPSGLARPPPRRPRVWRPLRAGGAALRGARGECVAR